MCFVKHVYARTIRSRLFEAMVGDVRSRTSCLRHLSHLANPDPPLRPAAAPLASGLAVLPLAGTSPNAKVLSMSRISSSIACLAGACDFAILAV